MRRRAQLWGLLLLLVLGWLVVYPLALVAVQSVRGPDGWTVEYLARFFTRPNEWRALWGSVWISAATVVLSALVGVPLAFFFGRLSFPGRRILGGLVALPVVLPPLVGVLAFLFLFGETGFLARLVQALSGSSDPPWRLQGANAILLVHAYSMYVYFYLFARAGLAGIDPALYEAAAALGAGRWRTFTRVTLPLLRPSLIGAALLTFMTSLASFSAPYIFGGGFRVMTTQIVATRLNGDVAMAMVETLSLTLVALAGLWLLRRAEGRRAAALSRRGAAPPGEIRGSPRRRGLLAAAAWVIIVLLLLPHLTLLLLSFVPVGTWTNQVLPPAYTLGNYLALVREPERFRPLFNSLWMAAAAMAAAVGLSVAAASLVVRSRVRVAGAIEWLVALPWVVPGTVFAIALATLFSVSSPWTGRFVLIGTIWLLPLAYLIRNLPMAGRSVLAGYRQLDPSLEEAAATLGAGRWRTLRRVTLPLLRPAIAAGAVLAFATGLGDFVTSIMLYTYDTRPISLEILASLRQSDIGVAAAYGVFLMVISGAVFALGSDRKTATA
ncbi:MAG: ABC transporter permease [Gemmatimonadales bacterium]